MATLSTIQKTALIKSVENCLKKKAAAAAAEQKTLKLCARHVFEDFYGNTQQELQDHIKKNHQWLKSLHHGKKHGLSTLAWDILNAHGYTFVDNMSEIQN